MRSGTLGLQHSVDEITTAKGNDYDYAFELIKEI